MPQTHPAIKQTLVTTAAPAPPVELSLEERLAFINTEMTARLDEAAVAYEVNTAHIDTEPVDLAAVITGPVQAPPPPPPTPYPTPVAALLQRAHTLLIADGWCTGTLVDAQGAKCLLGAIHTAAGADDALAEQAADVVLEAIRRRYGTAIESVEVFNDASRGPTRPLQALREAASLADACGI